MEAPQRIIHRVVASFTPGLTVCLRGDLPQQVPAYTPRELGIAFHSTIGLLSYLNTQLSKELLDNNQAASRIYTSSISGDSFLNQTDSFGLLRGKHIDLAVIEAHQVTSIGDLLVSSSDLKRTSPSPEDIIDIVSGARYVIATLAHTSADGSSNIVYQSNHGMTGKPCINLIISELAVIEITEEGLVLKEVAPGHTVEEVQKATDPPLIMSPDLKDMILDPPSKSLVSKVYPNANQAVRDMNDGAILMIDGFGGVGGIPHYLMVALRDQGTKNLTLVSNTAGIARVMSFGSPEGMLPIDHSILVDNGQIKKAIASFPISPSPSRPSSFELAFQRGEVEIELVPQGTLAERIRAGGYGITAFYTPTGVGTPISEGKETRAINGREYILEKAIRADFALIRASKSDTHGNLVYNGTSRNFNGPMATAASITIAEVDEIVEAGQLDPENIITPGVFVQRIVQRPKHFSPYADY